jgi:hypothetical protein
MAIDDLARPSPAQSSLPDAVDTRLDDMERRLITYYCGERGLDVSVVSRCIKRVEDRFADATVRHFLPILVEQAVEAELGRVTRCRLLREGSPGRRRCRRKSAAGAAAPEPGRRRE